MSLESLEKIISSGLKLTPMMEQYYNIKKNYSDTLLLFRMGDFYEVFFEDAKETSKILNITLTHRGKIGDHPIPMAGIPHHAATTYIDKLTGFGKKVAICEQVQDAKDAVGIVRRAVTQVVSPGMPFDLEKTGRNEHHYMASASFHDGHYFLVIIDFTTGDFFGHKLPDQEQFLETFRLYSPKEFITYMGQWDDVKELQLLIDHYNVLKTHLSQEFFTAKHTEIYTEKLIPGFKRDKIIKLNQEALCPIGALAYYICSTQSIETLIHIRPFQMINSEGVMKVTIPTLMGIEILPKSREYYKESLLGFFDKTGTAMGARLLKKTFIKPLLDKKRIEERQKLVQFFMDSPELLDEVYSELEEIRDLERILAKISTGKATSSDLLNTSASIHAYERLKEKLSKLPHKEIGKLSSEQWISLQEVAQEIDKTINDEVGASLEKGNLIRPGCSRKRDRLAKLADNAGEELLRLETQYREETGIVKLRVKSNNVAGYFIEVSKSHCDKLPKKFERRQTLTNSERFTTKELSEFEKEMVSAQDKLQKLEREIFRSLLEKLATNSAAIMKLAQILAGLDLFQSFAKVALLEDFSAPRICEDQKIIDLKQAWHPLIKTSLREQFVPHDLKLNSDAFFGLITGPNMAGKTTVMREVAIIQLLTQVGSFVPAQSAKVGLCDYLFSRLGASDDILKGQSTFMVEMSETAEILRHATSRSLIILDEVGRGTSTYDGLSIAWALVEHFVNKTQALTLFATHYHELIDVVEKLPHAKNLTVETQNTDGEVQFLYNLVERGATQSFGIYVAKLAGLPISVLKRSQNVLEQLEQESSNISMEQTTSQSTQLSFFAEEKFEVPEHLKKLEKAVAKIDVLNMTPLEAMQKLHELKENLPLQ